MKKHFKNIFIALVLLLIVFDTYSQCAMCKASAESSIENGGTIAKGVNNGIVYLMGVPYLLLLTFCLVFRKDIATVYHRWRKTSPEALGTALKEYRFLIFFFSALSVLFMFFAYIQLS
jgi:hypothetical protein